MKNIPASNAIKKMQYIDQKQQECNYSNTYYGDQVCIMPKKKDRSS